jgi:MFS family permease
MRLIPPVLRLRNFRLYWFGVVLSQIGSRATTAANLWQLFGLTHSTLQVGLAGVFELTSLLVLGTLAGAIVDRMDRRRLLQLTQLVSMTVSIGLAVLTLTGLAQPWHIYLAVLLTSAANTFDQPSRQALIAAVVPRELLFKAIAVTNPSREVAILIGPGLAGLVIAAANTGFVYAFDAVTYAALAITLAFLKIAPTGVAVVRAPIWSSMIDGFRFVLTRTLLRQLIVLDLTAMIFGYFKVLMPALALEILHVDARGYGLLFGAPSFGAIAGGGLVYRLAQTKATGRLVLIATIGYGLAAIGLAQSTVFGMALVAAVGLGLFDAMGTTVRHGVAQLETPDEMRGRTMALYTMASRGGPAVGQMAMGSLAQVLGPVVALSLGSLVPIAYAVKLLLQHSVVRDYQGAGTHEQASVSTAAEPRLGPIP